MASHSGGVPCPTGWGRTVASRPCASGGSRGGRGPWRPGAQNGSPLASAPSALPPGALSRATRCPGPHTEGGIGAVESRARPLLQPPAAEFSFKVEFISSFFCASLERGR